MEEGKEKQLNKNFIKGSESGFKFLAEVIKEALNGKDLLTKEELTFIIVYGKTKLKELNNN